jgi:hypothetical protein
MPRKSKSTVENQAPELPYPFDPDLTDLYIGPERPDAMRALFEEARREFQPRDFFERQLLDEACFARWRALRLIVMEKAMLDRHYAQAHGLTSNPAAEPFADWVWLAQAFLPGQENLACDAISRVAARYQRQFTEALRNFNMLRRDNPHHLLPATRMKTDSTR